jgi:hypothetical protein
MCEESYDLLEKHSSNEETLKTILTLIATALGVIQTVARAAEEPAWSIEGRMISADSCGPDCHCIIGGPPDHGLCMFFAMCQIDNGQYGDVKLDGVKYGLARRVHSEDHR